MVKQELADKNNGRETGLYKDCPWQPLQCIHRVGNVVKICTKAPCQLSSPRFGMHERIIDYFIDNEDWGRAYYYLQDLLQQLVFSCNVQDMKEIRELRRSGTDIKLKDYSQGCRVFIISNQIKELKRALEEFARKRAMHGKDNLGEKTIDKFFIDRGNFIKKIDASIDILKHLFKDEQYKREQEVFYYDKLGMLYDKALRAKKEGLQVQTSIGHHLEQGFVNAAKGSGLLEQIGQQNREKINKLNKKFKQEQKEKEVQKDGEF